MLGIPYLSHFPAFAAHILKVWRGPTVMSECAQWVNAGLESCAGEIIQTLKGFPNMSPSLQG